MKRGLLVLAMSLALLGAAKPIGSSQETEAVPSEPAVDLPGVREALRNITPLRVRIVISRVQDEKKLSSVPYLLSVNTDERFSQIRMTTRVPFATGDLAGPTDAQRPVISYENVGTNIDCLAWRMPDDRYRLRIVVEDSSVQVGKAPGSDDAGKRPSFRTYRSTQNLILRDGEAAQYTMATDKITGEVIQVEVSLTVAGKR